MKRIKNDLLVVVVATLSVFFILFLNHQSKNERQEKITGTQIEEKIMKGNEAIVLIGNKTCPSCKEYQPVLNRAIKKTKVKTYFLDTQNVENKEFLSSQNIQVTPTLFYIKQGKIKRIEGTLGYEQTVEFLLGRYPF